MLYRESLGGGHVKGGMLQGHLDWVTAHHPVWEPELAALMSEDIAELLAEPIQARGWYPFRALIEIDRAIIALRGDPETTARELGRFSAERNLADMVDRSTADLHKFFRLSVRDHDQLEDFGSVSYSHLGDQACQISVIECRCFSKLHCWSAAGWFGRAAELHGAERVEVTEAACVCEADVPACEFEIRWG